MEKFLKELGITNVGHYNKSDAYVIDIENSDEYGKIYSKLDKSDEVEESSEESTLTMHGSNIIFLSDDYQLELIADFDSDIYKLICVEIKEIN